jgi:hypothetical protein
MNVAFKWSPPVLRNTIQRRVALWQIFKCLLVVTLLTFGAHDAEHPSHLLVSTLH